MLDTVRRMVHSDADPQVLANCLTVLMQVRRLRDRLVGQGKEGGTGQGAWGGRGLTEEEATAGGGLESTLILASCLTVLMHVTGLRVGVVVQGRYKCFCRALGSCLTTPIQWYRLKEVVHNVLACY